MDTYRLREPPNQNENVTHEIQISPPPCCKGNTLPRQMGGRGLTDITRLHDNQVKLLQTYFLNKQVTSSLHAAVGKADDRCTPLDLVGANVNELATDGEYNNKVKRQWYQKALHGRHPYDFTQQYLDIEASNKLLTNADLFAEKEGFLTAIQD